MSQLLESLEDLRASSTILRRQSEALRQQKAPTLGRLAAAIETLGQNRPAKPLVCPDEYLRAWRERRAGGNVPLLPRAVRFLYWEPQVVLDPAFHSVLDEQKFTMGARGIQGLVRACHLRWAAFLADDTIQRIAVRRLRAYQGPNRVVNRWQQHAEMLLPADAPQELADWMLRDTRSLRDTATEWGLDEGTAFFTETMRRLLNGARAGWGQNRALVNYVCRTLLLWSGWALADLKEQVAECILHRDAQAPNVHEPLKAFIIGEPRFGDPRLPAKRTNWLGVRPEATRRLIEWLSRADIVFFFDHAFPKGGDPHLRKPFWLGYVSSRVVTRPLLNQDDFARLRTVMRQLGTEVGSFGHVMGMSSAFLLDFGDVCVIEFNRVGACYIYPRAVFDRVVPDFWYAGYFKERDLKRRELLPDNRYRIIHRPGWQAELARMLAWYGVRST